MQLQKINGQQNLAFGTAYINFDQYRLNGLPPNARRGVYRLLGRVSKDVDALMGPPNVRYGVHYTSTPTNEANLARKFRELFGKKSGIRIKVIKNTFKNETKLKDETTTQGIWLGYGWRYGCDNKHNSLASGIIRKMMKLEGARLEEALKVKQLID